MTKVTTAAPRPCVSLCGGKRGADLRSLRAAALLIVSRVPSPWEGEGSSLQDLHVPRECWNGPPIQEGTAVPSGGIRGSLVTQALVAMSFPPAALRDQRASSRELRTAFIISKCGQAFRG